MAMATHRLSKVEQSGWLAVAWQIQCCVLAKNVSDLAQIQPS